MRPARLAFVALAAAALLAAAWWGYRWTAKSPRLDPRGGLWFPRAVLNDVPHFSQADARWAEEKLGPTPGSLGAEGCAVASAAMILASYGADLDPGRLNNFLQTNGGYTDRGWLYWEKAAVYPPGLAEHAYEDDASYYEIDRNLLAGNPVIVRLRLPNGITHFVVVVGKTGDEYLIRDPGPHFRDGLYRLSDYGSPIEALRYFRRTAPQSPAPATGS